MPLFECSRCKIIENTALGYYWLELRDADLQGRPPSPLCSQCKTGTWHGQFAREPAIGSEYCLGSDGFLYSQDEVSDQELKKKWERQGITFTEIE